MEGLLSEGGALGRAQADGMRCDFRNASLFKEYFSLISVVMAVYNAHKYLRPCIESVLSRHIRISSS